MKQEFSTSWVGSIQPRKQRKYRVNAPLHIRKDFISSNLSKDLRKKYGRRSFPLRKDDEVRIMIGEFKGKKGKVEKVDLKYSRVDISGIFRTKKDGTKIKVHFNPSNLQIQELNMDDKKRIAAIGKENKIKLKVKEEKKTELKKQDKEKK